MGRYRSNVSEGCQRSDDASEVHHQIIDAAVGHDLGVRPGAGDCIGFRWPTGSEGIVPGRAKQVDPAIPAGGMQPQTVNENNRATV